MYSGTDLRLDAQADIGYGSTVAVCGECAQPLEKAPARADGEPAFVGYLLCPKHPHVDARFVRLPLYVLCACGFHAPFKRDEAVGRCPSCQGQLRFVAGTELEDISITLTRLQWRALVDGVRKKRIESGELQLGKRAWMVIGTIEARL